MAKPLPVSTEFTILKKIASDSKSGTREATTRNGVRIMAHAYKLIVFNIEKPENIGMLTRTAYAFGCGEIIIVGRRGYKVTGSGATHDALPRRHFHRFSEAVDYCRSLRFRIVGVEIGGVPLTRARFEGDVAFVLGNEGRGLADAQPFCESLVTVPQWGGVPSLNVAVAGAIVMFEFQKRQNLPFARSGEQRYYDAFFDSDS